MSLEVSKPGSVLPKRSDAAPGSRDVRPMKFPDVLAPFVPTPRDVVERMLRLAGVGPDDLLYDLGCGDGRIVVAAAQDFGALAVGFDTAPGQEAVPLRAITDA